MASTDPQLPEYDSGEDVIEVAYTPPSAHHGTNSAHNHHHHNNNNISNNQQPPQPLPISLPPLQLPRPQPPRQQNQQQLPQQPQSQPLPDRRPNNDDNHNHPPSRRLTPLFQLSSDHIVDFTQGLDRPRTAAEGVEQRVGRSSSSTTSGGVHHHRHHHHHHHHHHRHARLGSQQAPVRVSTPSPPPTVTIPNTRAQSGGASTAAGAAAIIDLTEEPDSPPRQQPARSASERYPPQTSVHHRHPRRTNSQRISPPSLERTDGSSSIPRSMRMASHHPGHHVIDLTGDSPDDDVQAINMPFDMPRPPSFRRTGTGGLPHHHQPPLSYQEQLFGLHRAGTHGRTPPHPPSPHMTAAAAAAAARDELVHVNVVPGPGRGGGMMPDIRGFGRRLAGYLGAAEIIGYHIPRAAAAAAARPTGHEVIFHGGLPPAAAAALAGRQPSPKPPLEEPPEARPGFTRDTNAEPEDGTIVVCPCCDGELAYDPRETASSGSTVSPTSKKRKRSPGEHHFWALKKCGHVYCADCFENRRPTKANTGVGFPTTSVGKVQELRCAVEGCDTKVAAKGEWIGIFL